MIENWEVHNELYDETTENMGLELPIPHLAHSQYELAPLQPRI